MDALFGLKNRRSVRAYKPEQIRPDQLNDILEAGTFAPTGMGKQSPTIVVVQDPQLIAKLSRMNAAVMGMNGNLRQHAEFCSGTLYAMYEHYVSSLAVFRNHKLQFLRLNTRCSQSGENISQPVGPVDHVQMASLPEKTC